MEQNTIAEEVAKMYIDGKMYIAGRPLYVAGRWDSHLSPISFDNWSTVMCGTARLAPIIPITPGASIRGRVRNAYTMYADEVGPGLAVGGMPLQHGGHYAAIDQDTVDFVRRTRSIETGVSNVFKDELIRYIDLYLRSLQNIVKSAYRRQMPNESRLRYFIVLKEDSSENRTAVFSILNEFDVEPLADLYPVSFQFYPQHLEDRIKFDEQVTLQQSQANAAVY